MKKLLFAVVLAQLCGLRLLAQESSVKILLNGEERFRFEDSRLTFTNPYSNIYIGDSAGSIGGKAYGNISIGKYAGWLPGNAHDNIYLGNYAGFADTAGYHNIFIGLNAGVMSRNGNNNIFIGNESGHDNIEGSVQYFFGSSERKKQYVWKHKHIHWPQDG